MFRVFCVLNPAWQQLFSRRFNRFCRYFYLADCLAATKNLVVSICLADHAANLVQTSAISSLLEFIHPASLQPLWPSPSLGGPRGLPSGPQARVLCYVCYLSW